MHPIDWGILVGTLLVIVLYGVWKNRSASSVRSYLMGERDLPWWTIGLSVMATQASAITFLSTPGQAYADGMRFAQFYFGLPIAMVILCIFVLPIYYRLEVYTAYEYLETRFDLRTRTLTAILFLIQRGMAAGITIFAPSIILSHILGWNLAITSIGIGAVVIFYTVIGGSSAVSQTQKQQMIIILGGMFAAFLVCIYKLPEGVGFSEALGVAGKMGKLNVVDFTFDLENRYTFWSGMLGGVFLFLSYFGTDQSQVQRYLSGKTLTQSRLGLLFNGIFKVPMQFMVLFVGIMVFVFYQFTPAPVHFNKANILDLQNTTYQTQFEDLDAQHQIIFEEKKNAVQDLIAAIEVGNEAAIQTAETTVQTLLDKDNAVRKEVKSLIAANNPDADIEDNDYVFITFVMGNLPIGLIGLLLAVIFSAAMSSTSSELNALATTTVIDLYRRSIKTDKSEAHYLAASKWFTVLWGMIALLFATTASLFDNLIEAVNIVGSLFYGAILGIFAVAFFFKSIGSKAVFYAALIGETIVLIIFTLNNLKYITIAYLWLNLIGCMLVIFFALLLQGLDKNKVELDN
ncbi:MAG: sodium:solute symporter [Chitinophagales bacterium]